MIIYVLCPDETSLQATMVRYQGYTWAKPILLPQTPYLEAWMYVDELMTRHHEWRDHDYVGCISHTAHAKQPRIPAGVEEIHQSAVKEGADCIAFLYRGDPLVQTACHWHGGQAFRTAWLETFHSIGWLNDRLLLDDSVIKSFYCNYWATTPRLMERYCLMMRYLDDRIQYRPELKRLLWQDSLYQDRGSHIAKMPVETRRALYGTDYYPMLNFVLERLPCVFFTVFSQRLAAIV